MGVVAPSRSDGATTPKHIDQKLRELRDAIGFALGFDALE